MKIGTCVTLSVPEQLAASLSVLRENGFDSCQLMAWEPALWTEENAVRTKELLQEYGVTVSAFWCGWEGPKVWDFMTGSLHWGWCRRNTVRCASKTSATAPTLP